MQKRSPSIEGTSFFPRRTDADVTEDQTELWWEQGAKKDEVSGLRKRPKSENRIPTVDAETAKKRWSPEALQQIKPVADKFFAAMSQKPQVFHALVKEAIFDKYGETDESRLEIVATSMEVTLNSIAKTDKLKLEALPQYLPEDIQAVAQEVLAKFEQQSE